MPFNLGINVIETDGRATPAVAGAATSTGAFCVRTQRGTPNRPILVTSFAQYVERFGGFDEGSFGAHLVKGFFDNGGRRAWVSRVGPGGDGAVASAATLRQGAAETTPDLLDVEAGYRGAPDPGEWADGYRVRLAPSFSAGERAHAAEEEVVTGDSVELESVAGFTAGERVVISNGSTRRVVEIESIDAATRRLGLRGTIPATTLTDLQRDGTRVSSTAVDLAVLPPATVGDDPVETHARLSLDATSPRYAVDVVNDPVRGSKWVRLIDSRSANSRDDTDAPSETVEALLDGGALGAVAAADFSGDAAARTGIHAFDPLDVQLLTVESTDPIVVGGALDYCFARGDCMFVGSVPQAFVSGGQAVEYGAGLQGAKVYGALYGPWILVLDPLSRSSNPTVWVPPSGHVMGVYARVESTRGIHKAPAGDEARLFGAVDVEYRLSDAEHTDLAERGSVNGIRVVPGAGIVVDASRTLSTDLRWRYVNVRLLFNYVKSSLRTGLRWVRQEPNRDTLWAAVKYGSVRPFLLGLWRQGAFGTGEPDDVFTIVCDESNNPPDEVDKGNFTVEVTFYPSKPAETVIIKVGQQPSGSSATEA